MRGTIVILCTCLLVVSECIGNFYPPVFWHYQNCVFRKLTESYGTNATKEYFMKVLPYNKVRIVCPSEITVNDWRPNQITFLMYQNLWMVDKNGYDNCKVNDDTNPTMNKRILTCNSPSRISYKEFQFHPKYNSEEPRFAPGRHYYFIATGDGFKGKLNAKSGGHCKKYHMKLHIYVCDPKKEDCVWNLPECEPTYEFKRVMTAYSRSLPPPTRSPVILPPPPTTTEQPTTITSTKPITTEKNGMVREQKKSECKEENDDGASVHMILNFVLGGVILFMAVVIVILACGLARKSDRTRPASGTFSGMAVQEPNANLYQESARFVQPAFTPTSKSPPQTPISINPPFYLAPMAEIRPRSSSNRNGYSNAVYGRRQDSSDVSSVQVEAAPMLSDNYPSPPEPV